MNISNINKFQSILSEIYSVKNNSKEFLSGKEFLARSGSFFLGTVFFGVAAWLIHTDELPDATPIGIFIGFVRFVLPVVLSLIAIASGLFTISQFPTNLRNYLHGKKYISSYEKIQRENIKPFFEDIFMLLKHNNAPHHDMANFKNFINILASGNTPDNLLQDMYHVIKRHLQDYQDNTQNSIDHFEKYKEELELRLAGKNNSPNIKDDNIQFFTKS